MAQLMKLDNARSFLYLVGVAFCPPEKFEQDKTTSSEWMIEAPLYAVRAQNPRDALLAAYAGEHGVDTARWKESRIVYVVRASYCDLINEAHKRALVWCDSARTGRPSRYGMVIDPHPGTWTLVPPTPTTPESRAIGSTAR